MLVTKIFIVYLHNIFNEKTNEKNNELRQLI